LEHIQRARSQTQELRGIPCGRSIQVNCVVADIVRRQEPGTHLSLKTQVPLIDVHLLEVTIEMLSVVYVEARRRKWSIFAGKPDADNWLQSSHGILSRRREAGYAREVPPRIRHADVGERDALREWWPE